MSTLGKTLHQFSILPHDAFFVLIRQLGPRFLVEATHEHILHVPSIRLVPGTARRTRDRCSVLAHSYERRSGKHPASSLFLFASPLLSGSLSTRFILGLRRWVP